MFGRNLFGAFEAALKVDLGHPKDPVLARMFGTGDATHAGVNVDHKKTLALPAVFRGTNIIGNAVARVPYKILEFKDEKENGTDARGHTSWYCVSTKPNDEIKMVDLRKTMTVWAMLWGNAVAYIDRPQWPNGGKVELIPLLPDRTRLLRIGPAAAKRYNIDDALGQLYYETTIGGETRAYSATNCLHIKGLGGNPYWGYDVVSCLKEAIGGAVARTEFGHRFYGQGANPAGFIEMPEGLGEEEEERFVQSVRSGMEGMGKSHRIMVLEEGAKFHQWTIDPSKAQFLEGLELDYRTLANVIGIKVHKLIDSANSSYNSLESANAEHRDDDLHPWVLQWKAEMHDKLLTENQKKSGSHTVVVDDEYLDGWVPFLDRARGVVELKNNDLITRDEGRRRLNFGPSLDGNGQKHTIPMNIEFTADKLSMAQLEKKAMLNPPAAPAPPPGTPVVPGEKPADPKKDPKKEPKKEPKSEVWKFSVDNNDRGHVYIDGVYYNNVVACSEDKALLLDREVPGETYEVSGKVTFIPENIFTLVRAPLVDAWAAKIRDRLGKQAIKQAEKGVVPFQTWVQKLNTESAPKEVQNAVNDLYENTKNQLFDVFLGETPQTDETLVAAVTAVVNSWRPEDENEK